MDNRFAAFVDGELHSSGHKTIVKAMEAVKKEGLDSEHNFRICPHGEYTPWKYDDFVILGECGGLPLHIKEVKKLCKKFGVAV